MPSTAVLEKEVDFIADLPGKLRAGQEKAIPALIDYFSKHDRGKLWMCCGSGKTVASAVYIELRNEPVTVVFTPYIHLVKQWRDDYLKWIPNTKAKFMCVCSEKDPAYEADIDPLEAGKLFNAAAEASAEEFAELVEMAEKSKGQEHGETNVSTDPEVIAEFLKQKGRKVVIVCYASAPTYSEAQKLAKVHANFGVCDEAHWTATGDKDSPATWPLHDSQIRIDQRLFATATVRHFTREGMTYSMDNENLYGGHVLVDSDGNPDPWTMRQAIGEQEAPPYRIVFTFVTDPKFNAAQVQLPAFPDLIANGSGNKADPGEVQRLLGQAMAMERIKAKYGVKKPLGFFSRVSTSRLFTDILNECKKRPTDFPYLSQSEAAISISNYELPKERKKRVDRLKQSGEIEVNNSRLFLFGMDVEDIDAVWFGDPISSDLYTVQACGRAQRWAENKTATFVVPVMLPYYGNELGVHAPQIDKDQIRDAFRKVVGVLDSLSDMDPSLRDWIVNGHGKGTGNPGIIEFDFPATFVPELQRAIATEAWRTINPETDFIENLKRDAAALERFRLEQHPKKGDPEKEAEAAAARVGIKIIPLKQQSYETNGSRMGLLRRGIKAYYEAEEKEGLYGSFLINAMRIEQVFRIYGWDKSFVMQDDFEETLKRDKIAFDEYRLKIYPPQTDPAKEAKAVFARAAIRIIPYSKKNNDRAAYRMYVLRNALKVYYEAGEKEGNYAQYLINTKRLKFILQTFGWDKEFIMRDDFEENLKRDRIALDQYRFQQWPKKHDPKEEAKAAIARMKIRVIPLMAKGYETSSQRINSLRKAVKLYYKASRKKGRYKGYDVSPNRVKQIFQIYGWDKNFIMQDDFEENLRRDRIDLNSYRLELYPKQRDPRKEAKAAEARAIIKLIPENNRKYPLAAMRMGRLRRSLQAYFEKGESAGTYKHNTINAKRVDQIFQIYDWNKDFVVKDIGKGQYIHRKRTKSKTEHHHILPPLANMLIEPDRRVQHHIRLLNTPAALL